MIQQENLGDGLVAITDSRFSGAVDTSLSVTVNPDAPLVIKAFLTLGDILIRLFVKGCSNEN